MIPGVNPRQLKQMMRQMGMSQDDIEASEVIIKTGDKLLVFDNPSVQKVTMQGQTSYQITGNPRVESVKLEINISDEDIEIVMKEANVSREVAKEALLKVNGDIADAIVNLS